MLEGLSSHVAAHLGLYFPRPRWHDLERGFRAAAGELGYRSTAECANRFLTGPISKEVFESLVGYLSIGETYFLREFRSFELVTSEIIPEIIRQRRGGEQRLRIWSAGCASGEEPYSMAILLQRMVHVLKEWNITILATDLNPKALSKAKEGIYTDWSFRNPPAWLKGKYFRKIDNSGWQIISSIRKMVDFSYLNLVKDSYPSLPGDTNAMDVIFCRNVLMYFTPELTKKVVDRLHRSLVDGGWLIVSPCEASLVRHSQFKAVSFGDAILFQKAAAMTATKLLEPERQGNVAMEIRQYREEDAPAQEAASPYQEALALYDQGLYSEAEKRLAPLLLPPDKKNGKAQVLLGRIRANQGELAEALCLVEQSITADKLNPGLHYLRAIILQEQEVDTEAAASLKRALYLDQGLVLAHVALANIAMRQGRRKEFRRYMDNALAILSAYQADEILPESEGMTAGRLRKIIASMNGMGDGDAR
jgi:chemotaxis protein methyltransferase CheR